MQNILIGYKNLIQSTPTGGNWQSSLPLANLLTRKLGQVARSTTQSRTATRFRGMLGPNNGSAAKPLRIVSLINHNLSKTARWRVKASYAPLDVTWDTDIADEQFQYAFGINGTRINSAGQIVSAGAPRIDWDPMTGLVKGILIEPPRTNIIANSNNITPAGGWTLGPNCSPAGGTTLLGLPVSIFRDTAGTGNCYAARGPMGATASTWYTFSFLTDRSTCDKMVIDTLNSGTLVSRFQGSVSGQVDQIAPGAYVHYITFQTPATANQITVYPVADPGLNVMWAQGACQLEQGTDRTSYIPTSTTSVTRTADRAAIMSFASIFNNVAGTFYYEAIARSTQFGRAIFASDGSYNNTVFSSHNGASGSNEVNSAAVGSSNLSQPGGFNAGVISRVALSYAANNFALSVNGTAPITDLSGSTPTGITQLLLGSDPSGPGLEFNGWFRRLVYWPFAFASSSLQAISSQTGVGPDLASLNAYNSGWVNALQVPDSDLIPTAWGSIYPATIVPATVVSPVYYNIEIDDANNANPYIQIGMLWASDAFQPTYNPAYGENKELEDLSDNDEYISGADSITVRAKRLVERFALPWLDETEADTFFKMMRANGTTGDYFYIPDPDDAAKNQLYGFLGKMRKLSPVEWPFWSKRSTAVELAQRLP